MENFIFMQCDDVVLVPLLLILTKFYTMIQVSLFSIINILYCHLLFSTYRSYKN